MRLVKRIPRAGPVRGWVMEPVEQTPAEAARCLLRIRWRDSERPEIVFAAHAMPIDPPRRRKG